jgi:hypothetical protein
MMPLNTIYHFWSTLIFGISRQGSESTKLAVESSTFIGKVFDINLIPRDYGGECDPAA